MKLICYFLFLFLLALSSCGYKVKDGKVYYTDWNEARGSESHVIEGADAETFEKINNDYGKDKAHVFYHGGTVEGADPETFELIKEGYCTDKYRAYYYGQPILTSTSKGFEIIDSYYSKDGKDVFFTTKPLHVCGVKDFKIYPNAENRSEDSHWSTDGCYYYFMNFKIPSESYKDVTIFRESHGIAKDKQWAYRLDQKIGYDEEGKRIIDTIDVASFTVTNSLDCRDKFGCINPYHGREECE